MKRSKALATYVAKGGDMPPVVRWPYDLLRASDFIMNVKHPTAGALFECGKTDEYRPWDDLWGKKVRLFAVCATARTLWHEDYVAEACQILRIDPPRASTRTHTAHIL